MKNRSDINKKVFLMVFAVLFITSVLTFSSGLSISDSVKTYKKVDNKNVYSNKYISVESNIENTLDLETSIFKYGYISVKDYDKKLKKNSKGIDETYEVKFYTGNHNVEYWIYKSDLVGVSKQKVKDSGELVAKVFSNNGYVTYKTTGFSTIIMSMPNLEIGFRNFGYLNLMQYFNTSESWFDHFNIYFYDPSNANLLHLDTTGTASLNYDYFEVGYTGDGTYLYLVLEMYENVFNSTHETAPSCSSLPFGKCRSIVVSMCNSDETTCVNDTMYFYTPDEYDYFKSSPYSYSEIQPTNAFDFNYNPNVLNGKNKDKMDETNVLSCSGATYGSGKLNNSYDFDGSNDYCTLSDEIIETESDFMFNVWFKMDDLNGNQEILSQGSSSSTTPFFLLRTNDNNLQYYMQDDDGDNLQILGTTNLSTGTWYMATVIFDHSEREAELFLNTVSQGTANNALMSTASHNKFTFGALGRTTNSNYMNGKVDEFTYRTFFTLDNDAYMDYLYNSGFARWFHQQFFPNDAFRDASNQYVNLSLGTRIIDVKNYFSTNYVGDENWSFKYYDYTANDFAYLYPGNATIGNRYYNIGMDEYGVITFDYSEGSAIERCFDGVIGMQSIHGMDNTPPYSTNSYSIKAYVPVCLTPQYESPPGIISPFPASVNITRDSNSSNNIATTGYDRYRTQGNIHFENYTYINVSYTDELTNGSLFNYTLTLSLDNSTVYGEAFGNITVILDTQYAPSGDMYLVVYANENKTFNDKIYFTAWNTNGSISDYSLFYAYVGEPSFSLNINNYTMGLDDELDIDLTELIDNLDYVNISIPIGNGSYVDINTPSSSGTAIGNGTWGLRLTNENLLTALSFYDNFTLQVDIVATNLDGISGSTTFYIVMNSIYNVVTPTTETTMGQTYLNNLNNWVLGLFPSADSLTTLQALGFVIMSMFLVSLLLFLLFYWTNIDMNIGLKLIVFVNIGLFLLFAGLNYIGTGFLIFTALLLLGLGFLKLRG